MLVLSILLSFSVLIVYVVTAQECHMSKSASDSVSMLLLGASMLCYVFSCNGTDVLENCTAVNDTVCAAAGKLVISYR